MTATRVAAGGVTAWCDGAALHDVRVDGAEVIRRIALVVRDGAWGTLPLPVESVDAGDGAVEARGTARRGGVALRWRLRFALDALGGLTAVAELRPEVAGLSNRAGLVLLLDAERSAGAACRWTGPRGPGSATLPELVGEQALREGVPQPLIGPFEQLTVDLPDGATLDATFDGARFELEDERNWTDGTFKVYGPPLADGPLELAPGTTLRQELRLRVDAARPARRRALGAPVRVGDRRAAFPAVGVHFTGAAPDHDGALRRLRPQHVRVDVREDAIDAVDVDRLLALELPVELAVHLSDGPPDHHGALQRLLAAVRPVRLLAHGPAPCSTDDDVRRVAEACAAVSLRCPVLGGTDQHFADLNRARPRAEAWNGLVLPMSPQVHGCDDATVRGALTGISAVLRTIRARMSPRQVAISPLGLTARRGPGSSPDDIPPGLARDRAARPETAAWLVAAVGRSAAAGGLVTAVTAFADAGPDGLFDDVTGAPLPVGRALGDLAGLSGRAVHELRGLPRSVEGFAIVGDDGQAPLTAWLAAVGPDATEVRLEDDRIRLAPGEIAQVPMTSAVAGSVA